MRNIGVQRCIRCQCCIRYVRKCPSFMRASRKSSRPSVEMGGGEGAVDVS